MTSSQLIISSESIESYTTKRFLSEALKLHFHSKWINPYNSSIQFYNSPKLTSDFEIKLFLQRTTGVRYDDFDLLVAKQYLNLSYKITNPIFSLNIFRSKDQQSLFFAENELPFIPTFSYRGNETESFIEEFCTLSPQEKFILKMNRGNQGIGVNLINGKNSLLSILETFHALKDQKFILQPYIEHNLEYRIFLVKDKIIGAIKKELLQNEFRGNAKRSSGKFIKELPCDLSELAIKAHQLSKLDYSGIDVLVSNQQYFILEINPVPGFMQLEELGNINIAKEILINLN